MIINLTKNKVCEIDDGDYHLVSSYTWHYHAKGYASTNVPGTNSRQKPIYMHHILMPVSSGIEVDHIDNNGLNNKRSNLRYCSHHQNMFNKKKKRGTISRYKGVTWCKRSNKWLAQIMLNGRNKFLGYYKEEADAAKAYDSAAVKMFGEFAKINFSDSANLSLVRVLEDFDTLSI